MMTTQSILWYGLAGLLALTGIAKPLDVPGFVQVLSTSQALPSWALRPLAMACGLADTSQCWRETIAFASITEQVMIFGKDSYGPA